MITFDSDGFGTRRREVEKDRGILGTRGLLDYTPLVAGRDYGCGRDHRSWREAKRKSAAWRAVNRSTHYLVN